jgi:hypothetical protein
MRPDQALAALTVLTFCERLLAEEFAPPCPPASPCAEPGALWLSTGATFLNNGLGEVTFNVGGPKGVQQFTFASGTSQFDIIDALNIYGDARGRRAVQESANVGRVRMESTRCGVDQFVCVQQLTSLDQGFLFTSPDAIDAETNACDSGGGIAGDIDCDEAVGPLDLALLLGDWGASTSPADLNGSGTVDAPDLAILLGAWTS